MLRKHKVIFYKNRERLKKSASPVLLLKKMKEIKLEEVKQEECQDFSPSSSTHRILFSLCGDKRELQKIVQALGGSLAQNHLDCTHLVMSHLGRSHKLLHCICLGVAILPDTWLRDSQTANKFLDPSDYVFDTKDFNREFNCDFYQTLATLNRNRLFEGKFFYITPNVYPDKNMISELIRSCGGIVEKNRRTISEIEATNIISPYSYIILTTVTDVHLVFDVLKIKKDKMRPLCTVELILSAILKQTFEIEPYVVETTADRR